MTFSVAADKICAQRDRCVEHEVSKISENDFENFEYDFENENGFFKNAILEMRFFMKMKNCEFRCKNRRIQPRTTRVC